MADGRGWQLLMVVCGAGVEGASSITRVWPTGLFLGFGVLLGFGPLAYY